MVRTHQKEKPVSIIALSLLPPPHPPSPLFYQFDLTKQEPSPPPPTVGPGILESGGDFDPLESPPSIDFFPDYIVTVIVPLIIAIVLCLLLAYIMFGRREGVYALDYLFWSL